MSHVTIFQTFLSILRYRLSNLIKDHVALSNLRVKGHSNLISLYLKKNRDLAKRHRGAPPPPHTHARPLNLRLHTPHHKIPQMYNAL